MKSRTAGCFTKRDGLQVDWVQEVAEQRSLQTQHVPAQDLITAAHGSQPLPVLDAVPGGHNGARLYWDGALAWHGHSHTHKRSPVLPTGLQNWPSCAALIHVCKGRCVSISSLTVLHFGAQLSLLGVLKQRLMALDFIPRLAAGLVEQSTIPARRRASERRERRDTRC